MIWVAVCAVCVQPNGWRSMVCSGHTQQGGCCILSGHPVGDSMLARWLKKQCNWCSPLEACRYVGTRLSYISVETPSMWSWDMVSKFKTKDLPRWPHHPHALVSLSDTLPDTLPTSNGTWTSPCFYIVWKEGVAFIAPATTRW
jgi:hypothetical protein